MMFEDLQIMRSRDPGRECLQKNERLLNMIELLSMEIHELRIENQRLQNETNYLNLGAS